MSKGRSTVRRRELDRGFLVEYTTRTMTFGTRLVVRRARSGRHVFYYPLTDGLLRAFAGETFETPKLGPHHTKVLFYAKNPNADGKDVLEIRQFIEV